MDALTALELRGACELFKNERLSLSSADLRFINAVELVADRLAGDNVIPIPQHALRSLTVADLPRLNGSTS